MRNLIVIIIFLLSACASSEREFLKASKEELSPTIDINQIDYEFGSTSLSQESLISFESLAISKFQELMDYIEIVRDENLDPLLRKEGILAISDMLFSAEQMKSYETEQVNNFVKKFKQPTSVSVIKPFEFQDGIYAGTLSLKYLQNLKPVNMPTLLIREEKQFGAEKHEIWVLRFDPNQAER